MIHWSFLIPTFVVGFAAGCVLLYEVVKTLEKVLGAIEEAANNF